MNRRKATVQTGLRLAAGLAAAITVPTPAAAGPNGAQVADLCVACHGVGFRSTGAIPSLDTLSGTDLAHALERYRDGRDTATIMGRIARGLDDAAIAALAAYVDGKTR